MATREEIYLAALLHDIGKFWQRADEGGPTKSKILSNAIKYKKSEICPENENGFSHKHVLWTAQFFEKNKDIFQNIISNNSSQAHEDLMHLSAAHHNPSNIYEKIIQKADHYSAGMDRTKENGWKDAAAENDEAWDSLKRIQMRPIFSVIGDNTKTSYEAPVDILNLSDNFIEYKSSDYDYKKLWEEFEKEFQSTSNAEIRTFTDTLLTILEKYTVRIPASNSEFPDVSLYDHLKTTAAFAVCLFDYMNYNNNFQVIPSSDEKPFMLIGGDLSGIQKFIYSITPRKAAKNLKGRSFYLQLLVENIVYYIIEELNLFSSNIVYQSGGGFYIIAPNTKKTQDKLTEISNHIEEQLFKYHKTELYLAIDYIPFGEKELFENIGDLWHNLTNEKLGQKKGQRFKNHILTNYNSLFNPILEFEANSKRDYITGEPIKENKNDKYKNPIPLEKNDESTLVNKYTYQQIELGQKLREADFWIQSKEKIEYWEDNCFEPIGIGYYNYFLTKEEIKKTEKEHNSSIDRARIRRINNTDFNGIIQKGVENIYGFYFYGGNDYPQVNGQPKLFEELAGIVFNDREKEERKSSPALVRLGILKMDVDNLGLIFKEGFSTESIKPSFSRYSTLSRNLDFFFTGYINTIWSSKPEYKEYTQIIYSGGDDLFIVGKWDILIDMAKDIYDKFKIWTCNNPNIGLSGGLAVVQPKFPLLKSALYAEEEIKKGKSHRYGIDNGKDKNSFSIFGYPLRWDEEFIVVKEIKDKIKNMLDSKVLSQSFPSDMFNLMTQAYPEYSSERNDKSFKYRVKWLVAYNFKRAILRETENEVKNFFEEWGKNIFTGKIEQMKSSKYDALQILALTSRWADYELRSSILKNK